MPQNQLEAPLPFQKVYYDIKHDRKPGHGSSRWCQYFMRGMEVPQNAQPAQSAQPSKANLPRSRIEVGVTHPKNAPEEPSANFSHSIPPPSVESRPSPRTQSSAVHRLETQSSQSPASRREVSSGGALLAGASPPGHSRHAGSEEAHGQALSTARVRTQKSAHIPRGAHQACGLHETATPTEGVLQPHPQHRQAHTGVSFPGFPAPEHR